MDTAVPNAAQTAASLNLYQRLPKGRLLPPYGVEYFNQLVAYYLSLEFAPADSLNKKAQAVADALIKEQSNSRLNWGDLSGLEMALIHLLPESNLRRLAWNLRARYQEVAGQSWYDLYEKSQPPGLASSTPPTGVVTPARPNANLLSSLTEPQGDAGAAGEVPAPAPTEGEAPAPVAPVPPATTTAVVPIADLRADLAVLLSELQRLRAVTLTREEQRNHIVGWAALLTTGLLTLALLLFFLIPQRSQQKPAARKAVTATARPQTSASRVTAGSGQPVVLAADTVTGSNDAAPPAQDGSSSPDGSTAQTDAASAPDALPSGWKTVVLVIATGAGGGLISMLRRVSVLSRLQGATGASTALQDTIALDEGKVGVILSPLYGAIFAVVLYLVFMGDLFGVTFGGAGVVPKFNPASGELDNVGGFANFAKLLVWSFVAGFAETFVPDVLDRLTAKNKDQAAAST